ncbi:hypothetical protein Tco_0143766 [Tanacetum coccineum]
MARQPPNWKVVEDVNHKKFSNGGVIVVEDDHDVIHFDNSSDLTLSTSLNDLDIATLHIDGQSMDVDAPPYIIDVDENDDIIDEEDALPHDLTDSDDEDLVNVDDDDDMSADVARGHGGDDRPSPHQIGGDCRGKGTRKPNLGGRKAGRLNTRKETRNLRLRRVTDLHGPQPIRFEWGDRGTLMPLSDHAVHWANLLGEIVREFSMHYHSWHNIPAEKKAGVLGKIGNQFDLKPHMQFDLENWRKINTGIQQHLAKIYTDNKSALKAEHWVPNPEDGTYDGSRSLVALRDMQMQSSKTRERDAEATGSRLQHADRCSIHRCEIIAIVRRGKQRGHILGVVQVFRSDDKMSQLLMQIQSQPEVGSGSGSGGAGDDEPGDDEDADEDEEDEDS